MFCHAEGAEYPDLQFKRSGGRLWHNGHVADGSGSGVDPARADADIGSDERAGKFSTMGQALDDDQP